MTARFGWLSKAGDIPARWDLRLHDWKLDREEAGVPLLYDARLGWRAGDWRNLAQPALTIALGVECGDERAAMLGARLGEALPLQVALSELAVRTSRLADAFGALPRHRRVGPLELDLLHRDARIAGRWLALHPREFALLWRLADAPGERVPRQQLLSDVWRLAHIPETNSLEVHVSRLRAKLAVAKAAWLVETDPGGGYRLACCNADANWTAPPSVRTIALS